MSAAELEHHVRRLMRELIIEAYELGCGTIAPRPLSLALQAKLRVVDNTVNRMRTLAFEEGVRSPEGDD